MSSARGGGRRAPGVAVSSARRGRSGCGVDPGGAVALAPRLAGPEAGVCCDRSSADREEPSMPDPSDSAMRVEADIVTVGLVATPPDHPAQVVERLSGTLPDLLSQADAAVCWEVEAGWGEVAPRRDGGVEALLDDVARRRDDAGWDVVVCLTDLPLQRERVPLVAHSSVRRRACVVSLPALGIGQLRGTRTIIPGLVAGLAAAGSERSSDESFGSRVEQEAPVRRVVDDADADDGEVG